MAPTSNKPAGGTWPPMPISALAAGTALLVGVALGLGGFELWARMGQPGAPVATARAARSPTATVLQEVVASTAVPALPTRVPELVETPLPPTVVPAPTAAPL